MVDVHFRVADNLRRKRGEGLTTFVLQEMRCLNFCQCSARCLFLEPTPRIWPVGRDRVVWQHNQVKSGKHGCVVGAIEVRRNAALARDPGDPGRAAPQHMVSGSSMYASGPICGNPTHAPSKELVEASCRKAEVLVDVPCILCLQVWLERTLRLFNLPSVQVRVQVASCNVGLPIEHLARLLQLLRGEIPPIADHEAAAGEV
mmetsp:Transcript_108281/g.306903  ORF Transcript_108281/g.306903 Transcript_108281/m.306903 type:complete len:202 (+) Transcript_108281:1165-1770(+)